MKIITRLFFLALLLSFANFVFAKNLQISGFVQSAQKPIVQATVTLWSAQETEPVKISETKTNATGQFNFTVDSTQLKGEIYYLTALKEAIGLMTNIGAEIPTNIVINEHTTIASVWTAAQFMQGISMSGNPLGLKIAAGNVPNLVDLTTGELGPVILDPLNSSQTTTLARYNTLANLLAACINNIPAYACDKLLAVTSSKNTLEAASTIARSPWKNADKIYALYEEFYPLPTKAGSTRPAPFLPYLDYAPKEWSLALVYAGGGLYAPGKIAIDAKGNIWTGNNWMPGSQSSFYKNIPGGLSHLAANGEPISPAITGYTGGGMNGVGYGTAVSEDKVWIGSFDGKTVATFDLNGKPLSPVRGYNFNHQLGSLQGVMIAPNNDVWIVDTFKHQVIHFPHGDPDQAELLQIPGLQSPFYLAIDQKNNIWVTNSGTNTVTRFSAENPQETKDFSVGYSPIGIAVDSQGNIWVNNYLEKLPFYLELLSFFNLTKMIHADNHEKFIESLNYAYKLSGKTSGSVSLIKTDGSQYKFNPQNSIWGPWGIAVDGDDNVWIANFRNKTVTHLAGAGNNTIRENLQTGDVIAIFAENGIQHITDIAIDAAGNVWVANNWDLGNVAFEKEPESHYSTRAGGNGIVVMFGLAKPVHTPLIGPPHAP